MGNKSSLSPSVLDRGKRVLHRESGKKCIPTFVTCLVKTWKQAKLQCICRRKSNKIFYEVQGDDNVWSRFITKLHLPLTETLKIFVVTDLLPSRRLFKALISYLNLLWVQLDL